MSILSGTKEYYSSLMSKPQIIGSHDSSTEIRGELGYLMKTLKESDHSPETMGLVLKISNILQAPDDFCDGYFGYLRLLINRDESHKRAVPTLNNARWNHWGSLKQFIFGRVVVDALNVHFGLKLHPIWGCLLSPTGGISGPGNVELISKSWNSPVSLHTCVHDASGYLYKYHSLGPGYNYLHKFSLFPTGSPLCCEYSGLRYWKKLDAERWITGKEGKTETTGMEMEEMPHISGKKRVSFESIADTKTEQKSHDAERKATEQYFKDLNKRKYRF